ncbi:MAG: DUF1850 domain-containing protein [Thermodesulfobacteriota bacterium]|nr:DUF1850 domain-containing protein [Thermodesulfobacteriota bacterium]
MIIGSFIVGVVILLFIPMPWLVIEDVKGGGRLLTLPLTWHDRFEICYTHSVDRKPVCEVYKVKWGKGIMLHETYFRLFGAGMGHWEGHGYVVSEEGWIKIKEVDKVLGKFLLRIGSRGVDHILSVRGKRINLTDRAEGNLVEVKIKTYPWFFLHVVKLTGGDG